MKKLFRVNSALIINADNIETVHVEPDGDKFAVVVYYVDKRNGKVNYALYQKRGGGQFYTNKNYANAICNAIWEELNS